MNTGTTLCFCYRVCLQRRQIFKARSHLAIQPACSSVTAAPRGNLRANAQKRIRQSVIKFQPLRAVRLNLISDFHTAANRASHTAPGAFGSVWGAIRAPYALTWYPDLVMVEHRQHFHSMRLTVKL